MSLIRSSLLSLCCLPAVAFAQESSLLLDTIVVSGGLGPVNAGDYARAHTVLTGSDLEARGVVTVQDALRTVPGVAVTSTGETYTQVRIRGSEYSHVLVLIDGVKANSPGTGSYRFTGMEVADIERIEVLRGPQSAIHGPNAAAGVISITTRRADRPGLSYGGKVELGGLGTRAADAWVRHAGPRGELGLSLGAVHSDGEDTSRSGGDRDFNDREALAVNGAVDLTEDLRAGFTLRRHWQEFGYDAENTVPVDDPRDYIVDAPLTGEQDQTFGSLWIEMAANEGRSLHRLTLSGTNQDLDYYNAGQPDFDDGSRLRTLNYVGTIALDGGEAMASRHQLSLMGNTDRETYRASYAPGGRYERDTSSIGVEYRGRFDNGVSVQAGIRRDFNDTFRDATSWNLSAGWQLRDDLRLRASAGRAVVNPTMFQQFGYVPGVYEGNPNLKPATDMGYEIGADLDFAGGLGQVSGTVFQSDVKDMISGSGPTTFNVDGTSTRKGVELGVSYEVTDWLHLGADYTYTDARTEAGEAISRVPRHQIGLRAGGSFAEGRAFIGADLRHASGIYDLEWFNTAYPDQPDMSQLPGFTTVNLAAHYDLSDTVRLTGRVMNLFDKDYSEAWGYYGQGRTAYVGLAARW